MAVPLSTPSRITAPPLAPLLYYVFDVIVLVGKDVTGQPLETRRELLRRKVLAKLADPIRESPQLEATLPQRLHSSIAGGPVPALQGNGGGQVPVFQPAGIQEWQMGCGANGGQNDPPGNWVGARPY